jgi:anti-sigma B factor antagonist
MNIVEKDIEQGKLVVIDGRFDAMTSIDVQKKILSLLDAGNKTVIIDFQDVSFLSSAGLCSLLIVSKRAKEIGSFVCLIKTSPQVDETLETTGFNSFIRTYKDLDSVINTINH